MVSESMSHDGVAEHYQQNPLTKMEETTKRVERFHKPLPLPLVELAYSIDGFSSHSASYHPKHILVDKPNDQGSRWSSGSNNQMQFVTIKLDRLAVVGSITFGKYHKGHVCNLKEFKVFGGLSTDNMIEILHSGLKNDDEAETFPVRHKVNGVIFPCQYIKIVPLLAWGANFNFSIWFVQIKGIQDSSFAYAALDDYTKYREEEAMRMCLKHFRQRNFVDVFEALQQRCNLLLEDPLLTNLHRLIVLEGNFEAAEQILSHAASSNLFEDYISDCVYRPIWRRILQKDGEKTPRMRGGHQMCIDPERGRIYLFGGWDGHSDLSDFWMFDIKMSLWFCLSEDTQQYGGPSARSCHKICIDPANQRIYTLGGYVDPDHRSSSALACDFFVFHIDQLRWECISPDIHQEGGPELIYDHQMCIDSASQKIYVFGGRTINSKPMNGNDDEYSGLYSYDVHSKQWRLIRSDDNQPQYSVKLKSRIGHSMLLNPDEQVLYIFAGQRNKEYLSDFYVYDIQNDEILEMTRDSSKNGGPDAGFTQRASMDLERYEVYVLSGLMREKATSQETVKNSFWVYNIRKDRWTKVYQNENTDHQYWMRMENIEPCPRFAHQLVYDFTTNLHYLFGGNPGETGYAKERLDDFWELRLARPQPADILRKTLFLLRREQFREMCSQPSDQAVDALKFLQSKVAEVVNHDDDKESCQFRSLSSLLFQKKAITQDDVFTSRTNVYEEILQFFPKSFKQPKENLISLIRH